MRIPKMFAKPINKAKANAPEIMLVVGVGLVVYGTIKACQASRKLDEILDGHKAEAKVIREDTTLDPPEMRREMTKCYGKTAWELFRIYAPAAGIAGCGLFLIFRGHIILKRRYLTVVGACKLLEKSYDVYRKRVINELGEEMDRHFQFGTREEEVEVTETDKKGNEKKVKKTVTVVDNDLEGYSRYARFFDDSCACYTGDPILDKTHITVVQNYLNDRLRVNGGVFLNEAYAQLGLERSVKGQTCGWLKDTEDGDGYIEITIHEVYRENPYNNILSPVWLLDFNCQGEIIDKVPMRDF